MVLTKAWFFYSWNNYLGFLSLVVLWGSLLYSPLGYYFFVPNLYEKGLQHIYCSFHLCLKCFTRMWSGPVVRPFLSNLIAYLISTVLAIYSYCLVSCPLGQCRLDSDTGLLKSSKSVLLICSIVALFLEWCFHLCSWLTVPRRYHTGVSRCYWLLLSLLLPLSCQINFTCQLLLIFCFSFHLQKVSYASAFPALIPLLLFIAVFLHFLSWIMKNQSTDIHSFWHYTCNIFVCSTLCFSGPENSVTFPLSSHLLSWQMPNDFADFMLCEVEAFHLLLPTPFLLSHNVLAFHVPGWSGMIRDDPNR